jgi:carbonic anhydrase/acetyltransferase-like protein (isoleucine patch superfamily)
VSIRQYQGKVPRIHPRAYIDPDAVVIGDVCIAQDASVWPCAVLRGDVGAIIIGPGTSIQDGSVLHMTHDGPYHPGGRDLIIGSGVTVAHKVVLHACTVGDYCLIGMGAVIMDDVVIGDQAIIGAGALVPPGKIIPPGTLWKGNPARQARELTEAEIEQLHYSADHYVRLKDSYQENSDPAL